MNLHLGQNATGDYNLKLRRTEMKHYKYEWNIDGLAEQQILDKLTHMTMVSSSYVMNHDLSQLEVVDLPMVFQG